jgi:EmrB/QacA subfamily drug resistance transporter
MITVDATIVNVALPSIRADLGFSQVSLVWVVNVYSLTYGGLLLLAGRLGDLFGQRRFFLLGITLFTLASAACGMAGSQTLLIIARAVQALGGSIVTAVTLALMMNLFPEPGERAKALGVYGLVCSGGGAFGLLLGGLITSALNWRWIFLINIPIGVMVYVGTLLLLPEPRMAGKRQRVDLAGAAAVTTACMLAAYAIVSGSEPGASPARTFMFLLGSVALLCSFVMIERRVRNPLVPLELFRIHNLAMANFMYLLYSIAAFGWFFFATLYMQLVAGMGPQQVGLAYLPATLITAVFSVAVSAKLVTRFGIKRPLVIGLSLSAAGLLLFAGVRVNGNPLLDVLPGMLLMGLGSGIALNPLLLSAMQGVPPSQTGVASGVVNTAAMMGGALGLAILASIATLYTDNLLDSGLSAPEALNGGYRLAFLIAAVCAGTAAVLGATVLRGPERAPSRLPQPSVAAEQ